MEMTPNENTFTGKTKTGKNEKKAEMVSLQVRIKCYMYFSTHKIFNSQEDLEKGYNTLLWILQCMYCNTYNSTKNGGVKGHRLLQASSILCEVVQYDF